VMHRSINHFEMRDLPKYSRTTSRVPSDGPSSTIKISYAKPVAVRYSLNLPNVFGSLSARCRQEQSRRDKRLGAQQFPMQLAFNQRSEFHLETGLDFKMRTAS
jgi:hypothetical protein